MKTFTQTKYKNHPKHSERGLGNSDMERIQNSGQNKN